MLSVNIIVGVGIFHSVFAFDDGFEVTCEGCVVVCAPIYHYGGIADFLFILGASLVVCILFGTELPLIGRFGVVFPFVEAGSTVICSCSDSLTLSESYLLLVGIVATTFLSISFTKFVLNFSSFLGF